MAQFTGKTVAEVRHRAVVLQETNPMLGHRGCRLGITYPEIYEMQAAAIFEAAVAVIKEAGEAVEPEIMVPLIATKKEFDFLKAMIDRNLALVEDLKKDLRAYEKVSERGSRVRVIGHASATEKAAGSGGEGSDLALTRADAVAKTLINMGVPANALETSTGGATYDESQPTGVAANRRVAIYIGS